ncbi:hypothetical protein G4B88_020326 [Cannabis sativa]|uniref:GED domain-containing protein n=1 Tax=Cannabis sativa TaxID=3483 RepID=A0A7J6EN88_CANSA|nr:hypothetical protein G4B88_020326 [Cannabis sativa]
MRLVGRVYRDNLTPIPTCFKRGIMTKKVMKYMHKKLSSTCYIMITSFKSQPKRAGLDMIEKMKGNSMKCVKEIVYMEKLTDYTCNPEFKIEIRSSWLKKMMRLVAYWSIVQRRLVDLMALHLQLSVHRLVNEHLERELVNQIMGSNENRLVRMLEESPSVASK